VSDVSAMILARLSVSVSVWASWNSSFINLVSPTIVAGLWHMFVYNTMNVTQSDSRVRRQ